MMSSSICRLTEIRLCRCVRLAGCENFIGEWEEFIFNVFVNVSINLEPVREHRKLYTNTQIIYLHIHSKFNLNLHHHTKTRKSSKTYHIIRQFAAR